MSDLVCIQKFYCLSNSTLFLFTDCYYHWIFSKASKTTTNFMVCYIQMTIKIHLRFDLILILFDSLLLFHLTYFCQSNQGNSFHILSLMETVWLVFLSVNSTEPKGLLLWPTIAQESDWGSLTYM